MLDAIVWIEEYLPHADGSFVFGPVEDVMSNRPTVDSIVPCVLPVRGCAGGIHGAAAAAAAAGGPMQQPQHCCCCWHTQKETMAKMRTIQQHLNQCWWLCSTGWGTVLGMPSWQGWDFSCPFSVECTSHSLGRKKRRGCACSSNKKVNPVHMKVIRNRNTREQRKVDQLERHPVQSYNPTTAIDKKVVEWCVIVSRFTNNELT
eukprot:scaffold1390_cov138-Cylindrotheca_fusiformis.AAC.40